MLPPGREPAPAHESALDTRSIARFFAPLALNAWLMTLAGPVLNVALARAAEPALHLAAFWLAFSVVLVCESACLVLQQVAAAALQRGVPLRSVARAAAILGAGAAVLVLAIARTPAGDGLFRDVIPAPARTAALARDVLVVLAALPLFVALRGLAGGVAVAARRTGLLLLATAVRVLLLALAVAAIAGFGIGAGARAAALLLVCATAVEAVALAAATLRHRAPARPAGAAASATPARGVLLRLALPLAASSLVWTSARPLVAALLGRLADPGAALAGFGLVLPVLFFSCAPLWCFLDVAIVLPRSGNDLGRIVRFALFTSLAFAAGIAVMAYSPPGALALHPGGPLAPELERAARPALALMALEPLVLAARAIAQGLLVRAGRAGLVLALSPLKLALVLGAGLLVARVAPHANGAVLAVALFAGGDAVDALVLGLAAARHGAVGDVPAAADDGDGERALELAA